jgi:hypothetical protein
MLHGLHWLHGYDFPSTFNFTILQLFHGPAHIYKQEITRKNISIKIQIWQNFSIIFHSAESHSKRWVIWLDGKRLFFFFRRSKSILFKVSVSEKNLFPFIFFDIFINSKNLIYYTDLSNGNLSFYYLNFLIYFFL